MNRTNNMRMMPKNRTLYLNLLGWFQIVLARDTVRLNYQLTAPWWKGERPPIKAYLNQTKQSKEMVQNTFVDAHCHLDHPLLVPNLQEIIERARQAGVIAIISNGIDPESNRATLDIAKRFSEVKPALGLYPDQAQKLSEEEIDRELEFIKSQKDKIIAIGEVGLDFVERTYEKEQKKLFEKVIELSKSINKPIIIHSRKAESEIIEILQNNKCKKVILHCFCGRKNDSKLFLSFII